MNGCRQVQRGENPIFEVVIRETLCVEMADGRVRRKPAGEFHTLRAGYVPNEDAAEQLINSIKRAREQYEMIAWGVKRVWWEAPNAQEAASKYLHYANLVADDGH